MIFNILVWVVVALVLAVVVGWWAHYVHERRNTRYYHYSFWYPLLATLWIPTLGLVALFIFALLCSGIGQINTPFVPDYDEKVKLAALATGDSVEGHLRGGIFLTVGHIDGKRVISYVSEADDGGFRVGQVDGSESVIYERPDETSMTIHHWKQVNPLWVPWTLDTGKTYTFEVPEGSVVNSFEVSP